MEVIVYHNPVQQMIWHALSGNGAVYLLIFVVASVTALVAAVVCDSMLTTHTKVLFRTRSRIETAFAVMVFVGVVAYMLHQIGAI